MLCYIDAFSGISGDMLVGALADAGAPQTAISEALAPLAPDATISWSRVDRRGIQATKFHVSAPAQQKHRHLSGILKMIAGSSIPAEAKDSAEQIFRALAAAEAAVHGVDIEKVHFHEVGAIDSICDIVGVSLALRLLGVRHIHCSAINTGSGTVNTEHGVLPVPAPATARLLEGKPVYTRGPALELATPTGVAVVAALSRSFGPMPPLTIRKTGYGAGDHNFAEHANVLRVIIGEASGASETVTLAVVEANIDDASPQLIGFASERLLAAGALDVTVIPAQMKKNRPGVILQILCAPERREELIGLLFAETTTLGVRFYAAERRVQPRQIVEVATPWGIVRIKSGPEGFAPEYEDARHIAIASGIPLKQVLAEATHRYLNLTASLS
jgi:uncharacterized protein (TIGR00299 family) protein